MTLDINVILATATADYEALEQLDTGGLYTCLAPNCCSGIADDEWSKAYRVQYLLRQYELTGTLPDVDLCCPVYCGDLTSGTVGASSPAFTSLTAVDAAISDDLSVGGDFTLGGAPLITSFRRGNGTLSGGTLAIAGTWVTATTRIVATYKTASPAANANLSTVNNAGVGFTVNGEGTHVFDWIAIV